MSSVRVCSHCGALCGFDHGDHYLVCACGSERYRVPGTYGGSRDDTYDGNIFGARPVTLEEYRRPKQ